MPDLTPGETAYTAFWQAFAAACGADIDAWDTIHPGTQAAWEAAARAVLADGLGHILAREAAALRQVGALVQAAATSGAGPELARAIAALKPWLDAQKDPRA